MNGWNERSAMVRLQLEQRGIQDTRVLDAMAQVPRHLFVPEEARDQAYGDHALPIHEGQTISQPYIVALMAQALALSPGERVLEIGAGSGYAAAVLSLLAGEVYTIERHPTLAESAARRLRDLGYTNVHIVSSDGTKGLPEYAPFDGIMVSAAAPWVPLPLREQLGEGGRLVIPVGGRQAQLMLRLTRTNHQFQTERLGEVRFVPLIGAHAWQDAGDPPAHDEGE
ncbi:protein-L-isoaspartate O-methyltransferase [Kouleothrix aurantiaca]|jgi:protein-L-isoaspartate(D-aspartate) O-methyltransferase|uniref:Protein-L-isoaspartate O-methyltransferase n=1 Tax=Kouleothrix aurantiaca TaxID=186479 RepID=A0A0P9D0K7_9CHLR|nr:protein-L-isoaspartate O-methyltransferase [Kouleothrix aurantiaca]